MDMRCTQKLYPIITPAQILCLLLFGILLQGCTPSEVDGTSHPPRQTVQDILLPLASGQQVFENDQHTVSVDASNIANGYIMVRYTGDAPKVQTQMLNPDGDMNPYPLQPGDYRTFPFTKGDGTYQLKVLEQIKDDLYAVAFSREVDVQLSDEFEPFLYPNQYIVYNDNSACVQEARILSEEASDDLHFVQSVYEYVISHISYDDEFAANTPTNYIPDPDRTYESERGICFDYAALTTAMLRSQRIPTKLVVGYSGETYHAWISVYLTDTGWIDNIIQFHGNSWSLIDPTLGANNSAESVKEYIGDGQHYTVKYYY